MAKAMDKNIDIAVARITPRLTDFTIAGLEANYRLNLTSGLSSNSTTDLPRLTTQGISAATTSSREAWSAGIAQNLWKGGGNYGVAWTNSRFPGQSSVNIRNPQFQSGITANSPQPLLRGFKIDSTRASLQTNRISQQNDEISLTATAASTAANVRLAYWDLVYAIQEWRRRRTLWISPVVSFRTTSPEWKSAPWHPSTSCRRRPRRPRGEIPSCSRRRPFAPRNWSSNG